VVLNSILPLIYPHIRPAHIYESIYDIDFGLLWDSGIRHVFFDVDNTLISYSESEVSIQGINVFNSIQSIGFETVMLVSNNSNVARIQSVASQLNIPAVTFACKPFFFTMRRILNSLNIAPGHAVFIGDQLFTDILMANSMNMVSIFVDPMDTSNLSFLKMYQYKFQDVILNLMNNAIFKQ
jgi:HAD superfamily phosphatase (TIGR01668 family)